MIRRPEIYISAANLDLGIAVNLVRTEILQLGATPVHLEQHPAEWSAACALMEYHLAHCDAVIHLAGDAYGTEPANRPPAEPRRSHVHLEYALARSLGKKVYAFVCHEQFPLLAHSPEPDEQRRLQQAHCDRLVRHNSNEILTASMDQLVARIRSLKPALQEAIAQHAEREKLLAAATTASPARHDPGTGVPPADGGVGLPSPAPVRAPVPWNPPQAAPEFVSRLIEKDALAAALKTSRRVVVHGARGMGKSSLISAALHTLGHGPDSPGLFPSGVLRHNFHLGPGHPAALASLLSQIGLRDLADSRHEAAVKQLLSPEGVCLVLEGAEAADNLDRLLQLVGKAHVVIESRDPLPLPGWQSVTVHQLPLEDAGFLLYRSHLRQRPQPEPKPAGLPGLDDPVWQELSKRLGAHPLVIELGARRLAVDALTPHEFLTTLERSGVDAYETVAGDAGNAPWLFAQFSQDCARQDVRSLPAWYALSLHALCPAPVFGLAAALGVPTAEVQAHLSPLVQRGLAIASPLPGEAPGVTTPAWALTSQGLTECARLQWEWRDPIQQHPDFDPRAVYQRWRDWCLVYLRECWKSRSLVGGVARFQLLEPHLEALLRAVERNEGVSSPNLLAALRWLSALYRMQGRFASAQPLSERLFSLSQSLYGPEHPETLASMNNLATLHYRRGELALAEPLYRESLQLRERILGPEHPDTYASQNNLANVLADRRDFTGAEKLYRSSYEGRKRVLGPEHPDTLISAKNLANLLLDRGELDSAEPLYRSTLETQLRTLDPAHPDTAMTAYNYARLCIQLRRTEEALTLARHAVDTGRKAFPEGHPHRQRYEQLLARLSPEASSKN